MSLCKAVTAANATPLELNLGHTLRQLETVCQYVPDKNTLD